MQRSLRVPSTPSARVAAAVAKAKRIAALEGTPSWTEIDRRLRAHAKRLAMLSPVLLGELQAEEAPLMVVRWVAWGEPYLVGPKRRTKLVLHLRHTLPTERDGWFLERQITAAFELWRAFAREAEGLGLAEPPPSKVPKERYVEVMHARAPVVRVRKSTPAACPQEVVITSQQWARYQELERLAEQAAHVVLPRSA